MLFLKGTWHWCSVVVCNTRLSHSQVPILGPKPVPRPFHPSTASGGNRVRTVPWCSGLVEPRPRGNGAQHGPVEIPTSMLHDTLLCIHSILDCIPQYIPLHTTDVYIPITGVMSHMQWRDHWLQAVQLLPAPLEVNKGILVQTVSIVKYLSDPSPFPLHTHRRQTQRELEP